MEESSVNKRRKGRYLKAAEQMKQGRQRKNIIAAAIAVVLCVALLLSFLLPQKSVYRTLCDDGYSGTQEQLIASLVGEVMASQGASAYAMAVENGYKKTETDWMEVFTGAKVTGEGMSTYVVACANGYQGGLTQWLNHIAEDPDDLGKSRNGNPTDYELACEYGFAGTFIEWIVSLASEQIS